MGFGNLSGMDGYVIGSEGLFFSLSILLALLPYFLVISPFSFLGIE